MNIWKEYKNAFSAGSVLHIMKGVIKMTEKEMLEKIELLEKRVAELEKEVGYIKEDIYEFVEDDECDGHCGHCGGCEDE
mgnify:FL=1